MQLRPRLLIIVLALASSCARSARTPPVAAQPAPPSAPASADAPSRLIAVDVFDTDPSTVERVVSRHGEALRSLLRDHSDDRLEAVLEQIRTGENAAYVDPAVVTYYEPSGPTSYLTIDMVGQRDVAKRMPFSPKPKGSYPDPGGLIATWEAYETEFHKLLGRGERLAAPADCPAFHCLGDPRHPALRAFADELSAGAPAHVDELTAILRDDHRDGHRAAAAFLLAYAKDGRTVVAQLVPAMRDASSGVRNNVMRVLAEIARNHPEVDVPVEPVIEALGYPATSDRNKAAATLSRLLGRPGAASLYPRVAREAGPILLAMLRLQQPNNHDFAYDILKLISGERHGERDYAAWQAWLNRAAAD